MHRQLKLLNVDFDCILGKCFGEYEIFRRGDRTHRSDRSRRYQSDRSRRYQSDDRGGGRRSGDDDDGRRRSLLHIQMLN